MNVSHEESFTPQNRAILNSYLQRSAQQAAKVPLFIGIAVLSGIVFIAVTLFEYEFGYRLFKSLSGQDNQYWTPEIMGLSSLVLICAVHLIALNNRNHSVVRFVNGAAAKLVPIYMLAIGVMLAAILYLDSGGMFIPAPEPSFFATEPTVYTRHWVEVVMEDYASPFALFVFSVGIGGFAILNIFVANAALDKLFQAAHEIQIRTTAYRQDFRDFNAFINAQRQCHELSAEIERSAELDENAIKERIAHDIMNVMEAPLQKAQIMANQAALMKQSSLSPEIQLNPEKLQELLMQFKGIDTQTLIKQMD